MKRKIISIILIMLIIGCNEVCVLAASQSELEKQKTQINNQISSKQDEIDEVKSQLSDAAKDVQDLINKISSYEDSIDSLNSKISEKENEISGKENEIEETQKKIDEEQNLLEERLVSLYESGQTSYIDLLLSSADLTDFISKYYLISELATYDTDLVQSIKDDKTSLENSKKEIENAKTELESSKSELVATQTSLKSAKSEKETKVASLTSEEADLTEELEELKKQESQVSSQINKLKEEYDRKLAAEKAAKEKNSKNTKNNTSSSSGSSSNNASSSYGFGWPVSNPSTLGTLFGESGKYWSSGKHTGVDFRVSSGTSVYSVGDGQVVDTGFSKAYGNYVEIYHGNNIYSFYAHNSAVLVSVGQTVSKGEQISKSGKTGNVTGPHLHFEIRTPGSKYANCVNPLPYLP